MAFDSDLRTLVKTPQPDRNATVDPSAVTCSYCKAEIKRGDQRWTGREPAEYWHYRCADEAGMTKPQHKALKSRQDRARIVSVEGCRAKAIQIRHVASQLSDPASISRALTMAQGWDDRATEIAARDGSTGAPL